MLSVSWTCAAVAPRSAAIAEKLGRYMSIDSGASAATRPRQTISGQCEAGLVSDGEAGEADTAANNLQKGGGSPAEKYAGFMTCKPGQVYRQTVPSHRPATPAR